jgi:polyisoprenoid-binding protein YceI
MAGEQRPLLPPGRWTIGPGDAAVRFAVRHLGVKTTRGEFRIAGADAVSDPRAGLRVEADIDTASVDTREKIRDDRLRREFFEVERFPRMHFSAHVPTACSGTITGELTIRDATRPVQLQVTSERSADGSIRMVARGRVSRKDFGLEWGALIEGGRVLVGDRVEVEAEVVARAA